MFRYQYVKLGVTSYFYKVLKKNVVCYCLRNMFIYKRNQVPLIERGIYNHYLYMVNPYLSVTWFPSCESYKYNNVTSSMSSKTDMRKKSCKSREIKIVSYIKRCKCQLLTHLDDKPYKWSAFLYCCVYLVSKRKPILTGSAF